MERQTDNNTGKEPPVETFIYVERNIDLAPDMSFRALTGKLSVCIVGHYRTSAGAVLPCTNRKTFNVCIVGQPSFRALTDDLDSY